MKFKLIIMILSSFILSSSGMFYDDGAYVEGIFSTQAETDIEGDDFTTTQYGGGVGYFINPNIEVYAGFSLYDEEYDNSEFSDYDINGTQIDFGGAYHYRDALDMNGNFLNLRFGAEYSMLTLDSKFFGDELDASATNTALMVGAYLPMTVGGFDVVPFVSFSSNNMTVKLSGYGETVEESETSTGTVLGMGINVGNFVITPLINIDDEGSTRMSIACSMGIAL